jgi:ferrochelatase
MRNRILWILIGLFGCFFPGTLTLGAASESFTEGIRVGILLSSFGDIDDPAEAQDYVIRTLSHPSVIPLPAFMRVKIAYASWMIRGASVLEKYRAIGGKTNYRSVSQQQADLISAKLRSEGIDARGYVGFTFTYPFIHEALKKAQDEGVDHLIVVNQGAQFANVTTGLEFDEVRKYLAAHPEWRVKTTGIRQFSDDPRFQDLVAKSIEKRIKQEFNYVLSNDLCIFLPMHGNIESVIDAGDPSFGQMLRVVQAMQGRFSRYHVSYGFLNSDDIPLLRWTQPKDSDAIRALMATGCRHVLINGRISFTVDSIESLYDQGIAEKNLVYKSASELGFTPAKVTVEKMFNVEGDFISFQATIVKEALAGRGDLETL